MARKTPKQEAEQAKIQDRLTGAVRIDASAVTSGKSGGATKATTKEIHEVATSPEVAQERLTESGMQAATITTADGLSIQVGRAKNQPGAAHLPQTPATGNPRAPAPQEGVSQRFRRRISPSYGPEAASRFAAEAQSIAARPNPLHSDDLVQAVVALHGPSIGGNNTGDSLGPGGRVSALAKSATKKFGEHAAHKTLGYSDDVQTQMLGEARDRIARRQGRAGFAPLTESEQAARAYEQVTEHLDEATHGTRDVSHDDALIKDAISQEGVSVQTATSPGNPRRGTQGKTGGLGMSAARTPNQNARRQAARTLTKNVNWKPARDQVMKTSVPVVDALGDPVHDEATGKPKTKMVNQRVTAQDVAEKNDMDLVAMQSKARQARGVAPEEMNTMSPGADAQAKFDANAQPVFSTGKAAPYAESDRAGVGVVEGRGTVQPPVAGSVGEISPVPPNLPSGPARIGRTREERGHVKSPLGGYVQAPRDYGDAIKNYDAARVLPPSKSASARAERESARKAKLAARQGNVSVAQTDLKGS